MTENPRHGEVTGGLSRMGWLLVAVLALCTLFFVGLTNRRLVRVESEAPRLQEQVTSATALISTADAECDDLRRALAHAREQSADAAGNLAAQTDLARESDSSSHPGVRQRIASISEE